MRIQGLSAGEGGDALIAAFKINSPGALCVSAPHLPVCATPQTRASKMPALRVKTLAVLTMASKGLYMNVLEIGSFRRGVERLSLALTM